MNGNLVLERFAQMAVSVLILVTEVLIFQFGNLHLG